MKTIIFDWDNTIVNSFDHLVLFYQEVGRQLGWPSVTSEQIRAIWGKPYEELLQALWPMNDSNDFDKAYRQYIQDKTLPMIEEATSTITNLKKRFLLGIITSAPRYELDHFMTHLGLNKADFFMCVRLLGVCLGKRIYS